MTNTMESLTIETVEQLGDSLNRAALAHLNEVKGLPLTTFDVLARWILYTAVLRKAYGLSETE